MWRTVTGLFCVLRAVQAVVSVSGPGPLCRKVHVQQPEFLAALSAHVHTRDILAHIRELLGGVCVARLIFAPFSLFYSRNMVEYHSTDGYEF